MTLASYGEQNWEGEVAASPVPVAVGFWAGWCIPCQAALPALEAAARRAGGRLRVGRVNVDENPGLAERLALRGLPTVIVFRNGQELLRRVGLATGEELERLLAGIL